MYPYKLKDPLVIFPSEYHSCSCTDLCFIKITSPIWYFCGYCLLCRRWSHTRCREERVSERVISGNNRNPIFNQFPTLLTVCFGVLHKTITSHNHFRIAREKTKLFFTEISLEVWSAHHENLQEFFFSLRREHVTVWINKLSPVDPKIWFSILAVTLRGMINISE